LIPKLKVWRLQYEERHVKGRTIRVLVLRNEHGTIRRVAKSVFEEADLKRWYLKYNKTTRTEDLPVSKRLREKLALVKRKLREQGFIYRELCFGTTRNRKTGKWDYKRVEVFKASPWTRRERQRIWYFFKVHIPKENLGIYVIRQNKLYRYPV